MERRRKTLWKASLGSGIPDLDDLWGGWTGYAVDSMEAESLARAEMRMALSDHGEEAVTEWARYVRVEIIEKSR